MPHPLMLAASLWLAFPVPGAAQSVFKCEVGGKVVYQSQPCVNAKASTVKITGGPSSEEVEAARQRAQKERGMVEAAKPAPAPAGPMMLPDKSPKVDCGTLGAKREQLFSRRNVALGNARRGTGVDAGSPQDQAIGQLQTEITALESSMRARGCPLQ